MLIAPPEIEYPSSDGEPLAESYDHLYAILVLLEMLRQYLTGRQAIVLSNQFLYYAQGFPRMRVAPDVMVIFDVAPGGRDNYKVWEEGQVPSVIFEITSRGTQAIDQGFKRGLYAQMGVKEYWLFDPKREWLEEQLQGYKLVGEEYQLIPENQSQILGLRLSIEDKKIALHRVDNGERLLFPGELAGAIEQERQARLEAEQARLEAEQARLQAEKTKQEMEILLQRYREQFGELD
jgi:Uma2 family endonuclease